MQRLRDAIDERSGSSRSRALSATSRDALVSDVSSGAGGGEKRRYDVFVSYNRTETPPVERIARRLRSEGVEPFFDRWAMTPGRSWQEEILNAMSRVAACAVFIGHEGLGDWAREELAVAQSRAAKDPRFRLFMVLLPGAPSPLDPRLAFLSTRSWVDLRPDGGHGSSFEDLLAAITGVPRHAQPASIDGASCPYRGLEAFDERHAGMFFGREDDTRRLCEQLNDSRFVAVLGPSGSGKSSVVKAGLIPALRRNSLAHSAEWTIRTMTPGGRPLAGLAALLADDAAGESMQRTLDDLAGDERTVDLAVALALAGRPTTEQFVLVVDQLEEVFTLCRDEDERAAFLSNLIYAATIPGGRTIVVVTLRADFYDRCAPYPSVRSVLALQHMLIGPLSEDGLRRAIEEPAWAVGLTLEPGLADTILADVGDRPGSLPLLQHVLLQVWQRRRGRLLTLEAYVESGGVQGALAKHADAVYERLSEGERDVTERVLLRLVQPGEGTEDARRRVDVNELLTAGDDPAAVEAIMRTLADERLLTTSRDELSEARLVEITHEALLQGWPRLRRWIERDREALLAHRRLTEASREWERSGRDDALLYRGTRLAAWRPPSDQGLRSRRRRLTETVEWRARRSQDLNQLECDFLDASERRNERERRARRSRLRLAFAGLTAALAAIAVVAIVAVHQAGQARDQRDIAVSRQLAATATNALRADPALSLALAERAMQTASTNEATGVLRAATLAWRALSVRQTHQGALHTAGMSPDGTRVVTAGEDGLLKIWAIRGWRLLTQIKGHKGLVFSARFSADGRQVASAGADGTVAVADARTGRRRVLLRVGGTYALSVAFSPDGRRVAGAFSDGTVRIVPVRPHGHPAVVRAHRGFVFSVGFSPDGQRFVTAGQDGAVRLWRATGAPIPVSLRERGKPEVSASFSPDGSQVVAAGDDGWIRGWSTSTGANEIDFRSDDQAVFSVGFDRKGQRLVSAGEDGAVRVWELTGGPALAVLRGHRGRIGDASFTPGGDRVVSAGEDGTVRLWDPGASWQVRAPVTGASFSANGRQIVSGGLDGIIRIWTVGKQTPVRLLGHVEPSWATFSTDGRRVVSASEDGTVRIWSAHGGKPLRVMRVHSGPVSVAAFDSRGTRIVSGGQDRRVVVTSLNGGHRLVLTGHSGPVYEARFSPDDTRVLSAGEDGTVRIWDLEKPRRPIVLRGHRGAIYAAAFSPDGQRVVSAGLDGTVRVWRLSGGPPVILRGHDGAVESVDFRSDGRRIASAGIDGTVRIWDANGGAALVELYRHRTRAVTVGFSPDGRRVVSTGDDRIVRISPCEVCGSVSEVQARASTRAPRPLNPQEQELLARG